MDLHWRSLAPAGSASRWRPVRANAANVTVVEAAEVPLEASLGRELGEVFAQLHRDHGVDLRLGAKVDEITTAGGQATGLKLGGGSTVAADTVLVAVGAAPNLGLAEQAGLLMSDGGVLVDASLRTSDPTPTRSETLPPPNIPYSVCASARHSANALKQPAVAAAGMLGYPAEYTELPYFFTDQYDLGMEYVGYAPTYERVLFRGDVAGRESPRSGSTVRTACLQG